MTTALPRLTENMSRRHCLDSRTFGYALSSDAFQAHLGASQRVERSSDGCPLFSFFPCPSYSFFYPRLCCSIHHLQCLSPSDSKRDPDSTPLWFVLPTESTVSNPHLLKTTSGRWNIATDSPLTQGAGSPSMNPLRRVDRDCTDDPQDTVATDRNTPPPPNARPSQSQ